MARFYKPQKQSSKIHSKTLKAVKIQRLSDDGRGIGKIPNTANKAGGKTVFIDGALQHEIVNANIITHNSRYSEAYVTEVTEPSPNRIEAICRHYARCGGCHVQHMNIDEQHRFKLQATLDQLKKWSHIEPEVLLPTLFGDQYHYRRRVRMGVESHKSNENKPLLGFRRKNSQQLIGVNECPVMSKALEVLIEPLQAWLNEYRPSVTHIELIDSGQSIGVVIRYNHSLSFDTRKQLQLDLQASVQSVNVVCWFQGKKQADLENSEGGTATPELYYYLDSKFKEPLRMAFHPQDFIQSNAAVNQSMVLQAIELMNPKPDESILDLFCGIGNFSLPFAQLAKHVTGVEGVDSMVLTATSNAQHNQCDNTQFLSLDLFDWSQLSTSEVLSAPFDGIILDPPRSGAKTLCENIDKLMPKRIVYVSCDSATFARDAQLLRKHNYTLSHLGMLDMFPQTSHSEVMGLFVHPSWQ